MHLGWLKAVIDTVRSLPSNNIKFALVFDCLRAHHKGVGVEYALHRVLGRHVKELVKESFACVLTPKLEHAAKDLHWFLITIAPRH